MKASELFSKIKTNNYETFGDDVQCKVEVDNKGKKIIVYFAESNSKRDWINNFDFPIKVYKNQVSCIKASRGWGNAYKSANDKIITLIEKAIAEKPKYTVLVCGWSYGGAIATLCSEDIHFRLGISPELITFGSPRVLFGKKSVEYVSSCCVSVKEYAHRNDIVPFLPFFNKHIREIKIGKKTLFGIFKPNTYHCIYNEDTLYK